LSVTPIPIFHSDRPPEDPLPLPLSKFPKFPEAFHPSSLPLPGAPKSPEDTESAGIQIDLTILTLTPQGSLFIIDAELNGVPVSALIHSGAHGCFISFEDAARLHPSGIKKMEAPFRIRGLTGTIKDCFESFSKALLTFNGHPMILKAVAASISNDLILGQTWLHDTNPLIDWKKRNMTFERDQRPLATTSQASEPTRCELLMEKQFSRMLRKEKVHCYALLLDETLAQSCMNGSEESLDDPSL
jgi:hypothetical protein